MLKILVAESDLGTITDLENFLPNANCAFAGGSTEAAEFLQENNFDLAILGSLGGVNERVSTEKLLRQIVIKKKPLLILLDNPRRETKKCGYPNCDYLRKPFGKKELFAKIRGLTAS